MEKFEYLLKKQMEMSQIKERVVELRYNWVPDMLALMRQASSLTKEQRDTINRQKLYNILGGITRDELWIETTIECMKRLEDYYKMERQQFQAHIKKVGKTLAVA